MSLRDFLFSLTTCSPFTLLVTFTGLHFRHTPREDTLGGGRHQADPVYIQHQLHYWKQFGVQYLLQGHCGTHTGARVKVPTFIVRGQLMSVQLSSWIHVLSMLKESNSKRIQASYHPAWLQLIGCFTVWGGTRVLCAGCTTTKTSTGSHLQCQ